MTKMNLRRGAIVIIACILCRAAHPADGTDQYLSYPMTADLKTRIETVLQDYAEVVHSLPHHPMAPTMLEELKSTVSAEFKLNADSGSRFIVEHYSDSDLGLYALAAYLDAAQLRENPLSDPCVKWCFDHPNTRVGCLAFDRVLSATTDTVAFCREQTQLHPGTRLAAFAGLCLAERLSAEGDFLPASDALLGVLKNPYNQAVSAASAWRAEQIWKAGNQWMQRCVLDSESSDAFVPSAVLGRLSEHLAQLNDPSLPGEGTLTAALWQQWPGNQTTLEAFSVDERLPALCRVHVCLTLAQHYAREGLLELATGYLERAFEGFTSEPARFPARVEVAFAAFSLDATMPKNTTRPRDMEHAVAELLLAGRFETVRRHFLNAVTVNLQRLPVDDQIYYALRIAGRQERGYDIPAAAETLRAALSIRGGHPELVNRLGTKLARIQLAEYYNRWRPAPVTSVPAPESGKEAP